MYSVNETIEAKFLLLQPEKDFEEWLNYNQTIESWLDKVSEENYIE